jgi:hypothetical protein
MNRVLLAVGLFVFVVAATTLSVGSATDVFIAQSTVGAGSGADCADAKAFGFFNTSSNWGSGSSQIGPGTTVHVCGAITGAAGVSGLLAFQGSGTTGSPITLKFEPGAVVQAPYFGRNGGVYGGNMSWIVIDGGTSCGNVGGVITPCNGTVQATANGGGLANQQPNFFATASIPCVRLGSGSNTEVKNLNVQNCYVHYPPILVTGASGNGSTVTLTLSSSCPYAVGNTIFVQGVNPSGYDASNVSVTGCSGKTISYANTTTGAYVSGGFVTDENGFGADGISANTSGVVDTANVKIDHNIIHDTHWCLFVGAATGHTFSGFSVFNNVMSNCDHSLAWFDNNSGGGSTVNGTNAIHDNIMHDWVNWDDQIKGNNGKDAFHHDGIHLGPDNALSNFSGISIYNNSIFGDPGYGMTAFIFVFGKPPGAGVTSGTNIFNNLLVNGSPGCKAAPANGLILEWAESSNIYNNTFAGCSTAANLSGNVAIDQLGDNETIENNIFNVFQDGIFREGGSLAASNFNDYHTVSTIAAIQGGPSLNTLSQWQAFCHCDLGSKTGDPNFTPNFNLQPPSSAIGLGANLSSLNISALMNDRNGVKRPGLGQGPWDAGASQYTDFSVTPSTASILAPTNQGQPFTVAVAPLNGYNSSLTITCAAASGSTCVALPTSLTPPGNFNLSLISGTVGDYPATVTVTGTNDISHSPVVTLHTWMMTPPSGPMLTFTMPLTTATSTSTTFQVIPPPQVTGTATLTCLSPPAGTACNFNPLSLSLKNGVPASANLTVTVPAAELIGDYPVQVQATVGSSVPVLQNATLSVGDFSLPNSLPSLSAVPGNPTTPVSFQVGSLGSFALPLALACTSAGVSGGTCNFAPSTATPPISGFTAQNLYVSVPSGATAGSYTVTVKGLATLVGANPSTLSHTSSGTLTVNSSSGSAAVSIGMTSSPAIPMPGELTTLEATVTNETSSTSPAGSVIFSFPVPVFFGSGLTSGCTQGFAEVTCNFSSLVEGSPQRFVVPLFAPFERSMIVMGAVALSADTNTGSPSQEPATVPIRLRPFARNGLTPLAP